MLRDLVLGLHVCGGLNIERNQTPPHNCHAVVADQIVNS